ncbi:hypothetical protein EHQ53_01405 [Leptospira langatensis]|uniref:SMP-30/Gluconolactonase/LRE-like region domain-containing protein n=2 Tax=Leptospira langatensis TaxID=2484983 RepID=A0A5F1ZY19_9LEPT|nr:hypothetical protein EHO57_17545 [Leptospira langatensis]TGL43821.1 hypothetical protein EHQ53_01405 [Leptospira langatensis]
MSHASGLLLSVVTSDIITSSSCPASGGLALGENAALVLGQIDFTSNGSGSGDAQLHQPQGITHDSKGIWVSDTQNNRVLHYPSSVASGGTPDIILGGTVGTGLNQFNNPQNLAVDSAGGLWVADYNNNRILHFPNGVATGDSADKVIGSSTGASGVSEVLLNHPRAAVVDSSGGVWVADSANNRAVHFPSPIPASGAFADLVLGQTSFTSGTSGAVSSSTFSNPIGIIMESSGSLWVSDTAHQRVMHFSSPLSNDMSADIVLGQSSFTASVNATSQTGLWTPTGLATDSKGGLWISDYSNQRAIHFSSPFGIGMDADNVLGEPNYTTSNPNLTLSQSQLAGPNALTLTSCGLWVADYTNNRVVLYP